jgi:hypothetical protein
MKESTVKIRGSAFIVRTWDYGDESAYADPGWMNLLSTSFGQAVMEV